MKIAFIAIHFLFIIAVGLAFCTKAHIAELSSIQTTWRELLKDDKNLIAFLEEELLAENDVVTVGASEWSVALRFKDSANVSDERLHAALAKIYHEAMMTLDMPIKHDAQTLAEAEQRRRSVVFWLGVCADDATKSFLLRLAADMAQDSSIRMIAVASYLQSANVQETKEALVRFLGSGGKGIDPLSVYAHASEIYDKANPDDAAGLGKQRAIITALIVAAANESGKIGFVEIDRILAMRSEAYRNSRERLALLERHSLEPPTKNLYTDADLQKALAEMRRLKRYTSVNTNAALLAAYNFTSSQTTDNDDMWGGKLVVPSPEVMFAPRGLPLDNSVTFLCQRWFGLACIGGLVALFTGGAVHIGGREADATFLNSAV